MHLYVVTLIHVLPAVLCRRTNEHKCVDDDQCRVGMRQLEGFQFIQQTFIQSWCPCCDAEFVRTFIRQGMQSFLQTTHGIFQCQIQYCSLARRVTPKVFSFRYRHAQLQHKQRFANLRRTSKYCETGRKYLFHGVFDRGQLHFHQLGRGDVLKFGLFS